MNQDQVLAFPVHFVGLFGPMPWMDDGTSFTEIRKAGSEVGFNHSELTGSELLIWSH